MIIIKNGKGRVVTVLLLAFVLICSVWLYWGNTSIQTTHINIQVEKIPREFDGFTIVQVSDFHNARFGSNQNRLLNSITGVSPDIIVITGDFIDANNPNVSVAMELINGAAKIAPIYYVTGNHEARSEQYLQLSKQMIEADVNILNDKSIAIKSGESSIQLMGLSEPNSMSIRDANQKTTVFDTKLKSILSENKEYTILLSHRPELFDVYVANNIDLALCGHAHGGQVRLPFVGGLVAPNQGLFLKYSEGVYEKEQTKMIVSRGLGNSVIPLRINNRPELVVITLNYR